MTTVAHETSDVNKEEDDLDRKDWRRFSPAFARKLDEKQPDVLASTMPNPENDAPKRPGFSRKLARRHGVPEAIVIRFIAYKVRQAKDAERNKHRDKFWYYEPLRKMTENQLPYFPPATLADIIGRLKKKGLVEIDRFNKWKIDKTAWYTMTQANVDAAEEDIIYFDETIAITLGFCEAVLIENVRYMLRERPGFPGCFPVRVSAAGLARVLPFSESTIRRGLENLEKAKFIKQDEESSSFYTLKKPSGFKVDENWRVVPANQNPSNPDNTLSNPDNTLSNPDDNTH